ncbi:hypothetical protein R1flu_008815 [Riccia fluitans]|uniref:Uncharacterized protein n=1 Tax=Riccia fluitans TaxID=41844 RepID=A0ABD1Z0H6_9MARC
MNRSPRRRPCLADMVAAFRGSGLGRRDPRMNGAERERTRLRRDTGRPSASATLAMVLPKRRGSTSFRLADPGAVLRYEVYLRIPNREVPSASRKLPRHH